MNFARTQLSVQSLHVPEGTNRNIDSPIFANDPASPSYWRARQSEVRALCREYGDPDLMITFTFVNHWPEVQVIKDSLRDTFGFPLDLRFCPTEEMMIWRSRFLDIKSNDFSPLITALGFGHATHFSWRLEFQARGAPHVHALVWPLMFTPWCGSSPHCRLTHYQGRCPPSFPGKSSHSSEI